MIRISVIIPTHNPHPGRLHRTLEGLRNQTLPAADWETLLVDNASRPPLQSTELVRFSPVNLRIVNEPELGLTNARRRGFVEAKGEIAVLVDDDNVLVPDYLTDVLALFTSQPQVGVLGGKSLPDFEIQPEGWIEEFFDLLALRDLGQAPLVSPELKPMGATNKAYPSFAPIGAGMALRRPVWEAWLRSPTRTALSDRRGSALTSGGDNDIVLCALQAGWKVGYFPNLSLTHLIPPGRLDPDYLARLNRGIQQSWMQVLSLHGANPWPPLSPQGARWRQLKAWFTHRPWRSRAAHIRWQGACGHFEGRVQS